ncbi:MAG: L,D-transpeptidase family protein [Tessaracoccus sp.]
MSVGEDRGRSRRVWTRLVAAATGSVLVFSLLGGPPAQADDPTSPPPAVTDEASPSTGEITPQGSTEPEPSATFEDGALPQDELLLEDDVLPQNEVLPEDSALPEDPAPLEEEISPEPRTTFDDSVAPEPLDDATFEDDAPLEDGAIVERRATAEDSESPATVAPLTTSATPESSATASTSSTQTAESKPSTSASTQAQASAAAKVTAKVNSPMEVGKEAFIYGNLSGFSGKVTIKPQAWVGNRWSTAPSVTSTGSTYKAPLAYGANNPGSYKWRVTATDGTRTVISNEVTLQRTSKVKASVTAKAEQGTMTIGAPAQVTGKLTGFSGKVTIKPQVKIGDRWSTAPNVTTTGSTYKAPLAYGANKAGTYTWRVVATDGTNTVTSSNFTVTRTAQTNLDSRCMTGRAMCISKKDKKLRWVVNGDVKLTLDARFGAARTPTRNGAFSVGWKSRNHVSSLFGSAMPFSMFFSGGQAVHYSEDFARRGYAGASAGCVNIRDYNRLEWLYGQVKVGDKVIVYTN